MRVVYAEGVYDLSIRDFYHYCDILQSTYCFLLGVCTTADLIYLDSLLKLFKADP